MNIDFTSLDIAVVAGSCIVAIVMILCTLALSSRLRACHIETTRIRKWFTEN